MIIRDEESLIDKQLCDLIVPQTVFSVPVYNKHQSPVNNSLFQINMINNTGTNLLVTKIIKYMKLVEVCIHYI